MTEKDRDNGKRVSDASISQVSKGRKPNDFFRDNAPLAERMFRTTGRADAMAAVASTNRANLAMAFIVVDKSGGP